MIPTPAGGDDHDQDDMPPSGHHAKAAEHHESAARAHKEAAKSISPEKQAHNAQIARGQALQAEYHGKMAAVKYSNGQH